MASKQYICAKCGKTICLNESMAWGANRHICFECYKIQKTSCVKCGKIQEESNNFFIGEDCYCLSCYNKQKTLIAQKEKEKKEWDMLYDYLCYIFCLVELPIKTIALLRRFKENYPKMSYMGMKSTIEFYYEIEDHKSITIEDLGIIPYHYERVKKFYEDKATITKRVKNFYPQILDKESNYVKINVPPKTEKEIKLIDISKIGVEEDIL